MDDECVVACGGHPPVSGRDGGKAGASNGPSDDVTAWPKFSEADHPSELAVIRRSKPAARLDGLTAAADAAILAASVATDRLGDSDRRNDDAWVRRTCMAEVRGVRWPYAPGRLSCHLEEQGW